MTSMEELNRAIGCLEGKTNLLIHNQDRLIIQINTLTKTLKQKAWYDSAKIVGGAFCGGFSAVIAKCLIWG